MVQTPNEEKRQRKRTPRSRNGCLTCKIRHLKCGEERPICRRCLDDGMECDGYIRGKTSQNPGARAILPKGNKLPMIRISQSPFESDHELQYFDLFTKHTIFNILPVMDSNELKDMLLQTCSSHPAIRHAVFAIAALDKVSQTPTATSNPYLDQATDPKLQHYRAALTQYTKAIQAMRSAANSNLDPKIALLTCHLIICFEAWTGNFQSVIQQITIAINLISSWQFKHYDGTIASDLLISEFSRTNGILHELLLIFRRLLICLQFYNPSWTPKPCASLPLANRPSLSSMPNSFTTIEEAAQYHDSILRPTIDFTSSHHVNPRPIDPDSGLAPLPKFGASSIPMAATRWMKGFSPLLSALTSNNTQSKDARYARILQVQMCAKYIVASSICHPDDESVYDLYTPYFAQIVRLSEEVLKFEGDKRGSGGTFCFDNRIVMSLWIAGTKCRERTVREGALKLLKTYPRREGLWDSEFSAGAVGWVKELEERGGDPSGKVDEWRRVVGVNWESDLVERRAVLRCRQRGREGGEWVKREGEINW
ncbi:uncharacterized protein PAC_08973 [Phialocephala subalpina]|uniref:Zn(2)-C6 fungal-type domain-containing protein n=1 Tax=Phialocephala subalpina TaxID=576137 RepID=A0A1L7X234_9HELO|nr:uncharacterized protein PAC_08973 [Phialocephala subalpina]